MYVVAVFATMLVPVFLLRDFTVGERLVLSGEASPETNAPNRIRLPLKTWIDRSLPPFGKGPCPTGCKHMRLAYNPENERIYFLGGDYSGPGGMSAGRNEIYSYSITTNDWKLEYPYCGPAKEVQPSHPDEVGWVWDSKRRFFWTLPGFMYGTAHANQCPKGSAQQMTNILTFDPKTNKWSNPNAAPEPTPAEKPKNGIYDPVTDSIYRSGYDHRGLIWTVYHIQSNSWDVYQTPQDVNGTYINDVTLGFEYLAADLARRKIYAVDPIYYRLFQFDMDRHTLRIMAPIPELDPARLAQSRNHSWTLKDFTYPVFDSLNNVLLYPYAPNLDGHPKLLIYHPDKNQWEIDPMHQPKAMRVRGNHAVFDPQQNVLLIIGGLVGGDLDPSLTHFFLYRYGEGLSGTARELK